MRIPVKLLRLQQAESAISNDELSPIWHVDERLQLVFPEDVEPRVGENKKVR